MSIHHRRRFIQSLSVAAFSTSVSSASTVHAQSTVSVTGQILSSSGDSIADDALKFVGTQTEEVFTTTTSSDGAFQIDLPADSRYIFNYIQSPSAEVVPDRPDNIPSHLLVREIDVGSDPKELGNVELPEAHRVKAQVLDTNDHPVPDATIQIRSDGFGLPPGTFTTNADGYIKHSNADQHGVDLAGPVQIGAWPPGERMEGRPPAIKRVLVNQDQSLTLSLEGFAVKASTGSSGDGTNPGGSEGDGRERGFFSNSGNEPAFLSNVFSLTMLGFLMSAAGLIYQLTEGR